ncbi:hypothetical protein QTL86_16805 [Cellulosilyticum sp. ST5]|uniref:hypothetical protein n=1 Tax=Cellulosilyticum sp. ST5 TaxID=3055805 RepID=UPI00397758C5
MEDLQEDFKRGIYLHINQYRWKIVREATRIQTSLDDYIVEGSRTAQFTQVRNAAPL